MYVGPEITRAVGKPIFSLFKAVPTTFVLASGVGISVGVVLLLSSDPSERHPTIVRWLGCFCVAFYIGTLILCIVKLLRGTWSDFCDWWLGVLESL